MGPAGRIDNLSSRYDFRATVDVLRLDLLHPVVSGNKWYKLKFYLAEAITRQQTVLTFGGAYSNHIVATAAATANTALKSIGIIRGEKPAALSPTLTAATAYGMELHFSSREAYRQKLIPKTILEKYAPGELMFVPEGGYGTKGAAGASEILLQTDTTSYTHIISAVGTGTTLAGLVAAATNRQQVIGVSVMKNNFSLDAAVKALLPAEKHPRAVLLHDYHFGGYAKSSKDLFSFMNSLYEKTGVPTDFVYTGKAFFAAFDLLDKGYFSAADKVLLVHTGGLQGNLSLTKGTLIFGQ